MRIELSPHAELQIEQRKLDRHLVERVAADPERLVPEVANLRWAQSRYDRKGRPHLLRVLVIDQNDVRVVLTVYTTSKIAKYWGAER